MKQEYSVQGFWAFPIGMPEREVLNYMVQSLAEKIKPVKKFQLEIFHSPHFRNMQGFWGLDPFSVASESFSILGDFETEVPVDHPVYLKHIIAPFPGLIIVDSKFEHQTFKNSESGLEGLFLNFFYINDPKLGTKAELVFDLGLYKCGEEMSQNPNVRDLRIYRRENGYTLTAALSDPKLKEFIQEWQRLQEKYRYKAKPDGETIATGSGDVSLYTMGPLRNVSRNYLEGMHSRIKLELDTIKKEPRALLVD